MAKASDLIKAAGTRPRPRTVPPALLKELQALCDHNDNALAANRVHATQACKMLADAGVQCHTVATLQIICREQLGRASWAKK